MATWKGNENLPPDYVESILALLGHPAVQQPNVEEDLGAWPEATQDYVPRPGQKNYLAQQLMAERGAPSAHPNGYWMATTPATVPAHALPGYMGEQGVATPQDLQNWLPPPQEEPTFPVPPGGQHGFNGFINSLAARRR